MFVWEEDQEKPSHTLNDNVLSSLSWQGFFASFMPLYSIERHSKSRKGSKKKKVSETEPKSTESEKTVEEESDASASDREDGEFDEQETNTQSSS